MNNIDLFSFLYIAFRFAPFILVSYFTLSSVFNQDLKGFVYLGGLLIACFIAVLVSNSAGDTLFSNDNKDIDNDMFNGVTKVCNLMTIGKTGPISNIPLSLLVLVYTLFYLSAFIWKYKLASQNIPTLIILPSLVIGEIFWHTYNKCASPIAVIAAIILGLALGVGFAYAIMNTGNKKLTYFSGISNKESCTAAKNQVFRCVK